jgi:hypothetical protein
MLPPALASRLLYWRFLAHLSIHETANTEIRNTKTMKPTVIISAITALTSVVAFAVASARAKSNTDAPNRLTGDKAAIERNLEAGNARRAVTKKVLTLDVIGWFLLVAAAILAFA